MSTSGLGDQYYKARNQVAVSSGLLILLRIGALATDGPIPILNVRLRDSGEFALIVLGVMLYSLVYMFITWSQAHPLRRKRKTSRLDLAIAILLAAVAVVLYFMPFGIISTWSGRALDWRSIGVFDVLWAVVLLGLGIGSGGFVWAWLVLPFVIRSAEQARSLGLHRIPVAIRATMRASVLTSVLAFALVAYKTRDYPNPFASIWPWFVLIPIGIGILAFGWDFFVVPSFSKAKRRSLREHFAATKAAYIEHDRSYQIHGWDRPPSHEHSPLFVVAAHGDLGSIHDLVYDRDHIDAREVCGWTPLTIAAANGHEGVVRLLLDLGADPNSFNLRGRTALMFAARYGFEKIASALIQGGADVNMTDLARSPNALQIAAHHGHLPVVRLLLEHGANTDVRDSQGKTALDFAVDAGHADIASLINEVSGRSEAK